MDNFPLELVYHIFENATDWKTYANLLFVSHSFYYIGSRPYLIQTAKMNQHEQEYSSATEEVERMITYFEGLVIEQRTVSDEEKIAIFKNLLIWGRDSIAWFDSINGHIGGVTTDLNLRIITWNNLDIRLKLFKNRFKSIYLSDDSAKTILSRIVDDIFNVRQILYNLQNNIN